jgi:hypothetical protein
MKDIRFLYEKITCSSFHSIEIYIYQMSYNYIHFSFLVKTDYCSKNQGCLVMLKKLRKMVYEILRLQYSTVQLLTAMQNLKFSYGITMVPGGFPRRDP